MRLKVASQYLPMPQSALNQFGELYHAPTGEDEQGELMTSANTTIRQGMDAARAAGKIRTAPTMYIAEVEGEVPVEVATEAEATHVIEQIPSIYIGGDFDVDGMALATAEGSNYANVKLNLAQFKAYLSTGILPV